MTYKTEVVRRHIEAATQMLLATARCSPAR